MLDELFKRLRFKLDARFRSRRQLPIALPTVSGSPRRGASISGSAAREPSEKRSGDR
jgi:hypothetical protein